MANGNGPDPYGGLLELLSIGTHPSRATTITGTPDDSRDDDGDDLLARLLGRGKDFGAQALRGLGEGGIALGQRGGNLATKGLVESLGGPSLPDPLRMLMGPLGGVPSEPLRDDVISNITRGAERERGLQAATYGEPEGAAGVAGGFFGRGAAEMLPFMSGVGAIESPSLLANIGAGAAAEIPVALGSAASAREAPEQTVAGGLAPLLDTGPVQAPELKAALEKAAGDPLLTFLLEAGGGTLLGIPFAAHGARGARGRLDARKLADMDEAAAAFADVRAERAEAPGQPRESRAAAEQVEVEPATSAEGVVQRIREAIENREPDTSIRERRSSAATEASDRPLFRDDVGEPRPEPIEALGTPRAPSPEPERLLFDARGRPVAVADLVDDRLRELGIARDAVERRAEAVERPALMRGPLVTPPPARLAAEAIEATEPPSVRPIAEPRPAPRLDLEPEPTTTTPQPEIGRPEPPERVAERPPVEEVPTVAPPRPETNPIRARRQAREAAETAAGAEGEGRVVESFPVEQIEVDAERFQFKIGASERGTTGALRDVEKFDKDLAGIVQVWRDPADGKVYVVNGHHRLALAERTGQPDLTVRFIDAPDAETARSIGAITNIGEGRGTSVDAAKFFRDSGLGPDDLKARGLSLSEAKAGEGLALSKLHPSIFSAVATGQMPAARGAAIGSSGLSEDMQLALVKMLDKAEARGKRLTNNEVSALADEIRGTSSRTETQETLFGTEQFERSNIVEKAEVRAYVKEQLAKDRRLFKAAERIGSPIEERGIGQIDVEKAGKLGSEAQTQEGMFDILAGGGRAGEINDILNDEAAAMVAGKESPSAVKTRALERVREAIQAVVRGGEGEGAGRGAGVPGPREGAEGARPTAPDLFGGESPLEATRGVATEEPQGAGRAAPPAAEPEGATPSAAPSRVQRETDTLTSKIAAADSRVAGELYEEFASGMQARMDRGDLDVDAGLDAIKAAEKSFLDRMRALGKMGESGSAPLIAELSTRLARAAIDSRRAVAEGTEETAGRVVQSLGRVTDVLRRVGPAGRVLADQTERVTRLAQKRAEADKLDIDRILKPLRGRRHGEDREQIGRFLMGRISGEKLTAAQRQVAEGLRAVWDRALEEFRRLGGKRRMEDGTLADARGSGNPMPQVLNKDGHAFVEEAIRDKGASPRVLRWAEKMVEQGRADNVEEAIAELMRYGDAQLRRQNSYLESTRILMPEEFVELDPLRVARGLSEQNALTVEAARVWGLSYADGLGRYPALEDAIENLGGEGAEKALVKRLKKYYATAVGTGDYTLKWDQKVGGLLSNYETTVRLGFSVLSALRNAGQRVVNLADYPLTVHARALAKYPPLLSKWIPAAKRLEDEILRSGAVAPRTASLDITHGAGEHLTNQALRIFSRVEKENQVYTALVAKMGLEHDINRLAKLQGADSPLGRFLRASFGGAAERRVQRALPGLSDEALAERIMSGARLSADEMDEAAFRLVNNTQFAINMATKQMWWDTSPWLRMGFKFKTFGLRQMEVIYRQVVKEAAKGNPAPLARFTAGTILLGEIYNIARDNVVGDEQSLTKRLLGKSKEGVSGNEVAWTLAKNLADGGGIGMLADMSFGISSYLGGPAVSTVGNVSEFANAVLNRPSDVTNAAKVLAGKEVSVLRQVRGARELVGGNDRFFDYRTWRQRAFEFRDAKEQDTVGRKVAGFGSDVVKGKPSYDTTDRTLRYKKAADEITAGDLAAATEYMASVIRDAETPKEREERITGLRNSLNSKSPLGPVAEADRRAFLSKLPVDQRADADRFQREWERDAERALQAAIRQARRPK